jgi:hypothetical protein
LPSEQATETPSAAVLVALRYALDFNSLPISVSFVTARIDEHSNGRMRAYGAAKYLPQALHRNC